MKQELRDKFKLVVVKNHWNQIGFNVGIQRGIDRERKRIVELLRSEESYGEFRRHILGNGGHPQDLTDYLVEQVRRED